MSSESLVSDTGSIIIPADVPKSMQETYRRNYLKATYGTGRMMLFAGDQKIEHLNDDFYSESEDEVSPEDRSPNHLFNIASKSAAGTFASQLGLINLYAPHYPNVSYIAKLNSKSHLIKTEQRDPVSRAIWSVDDVCRVCDTGNVDLIGVGYTIYLGSEYESEMFTEAAQIITQAHRQGMLSVIWMYPRGKAVEHEFDAHLIAGACGTAACLGADFVKVNYPKDDNAAEKFKESILAAGHTGVICAGGKSSTPEEFLQTLHDQIHISGARGSATGRNVHQKNLVQATRLCDAISSIIYTNDDVESALEIYHGDKKWSLETA